MYADYKVKVDVSTSSVARRVGLGSIAVLLGQGITIFGQVLVVPLFLWAWGAERYGEWLSLYAMVGYLTMLNLGMQMYIVNCMNQNYTRGEIVKYNQILHSALKLFLAIVAIGGLLVAVLLFLAPLEIWLHFIHTPHMTAALVGLLLSLQILGGIPIGLIVGTYRTFGELPRGQMVTNIQRFCLFALTALILFLSGGLLEVAAVQLLPLVGVVIYVLTDLRLRHPEISIGISNADWRLAMSFLGPSLLFLLIQLSVGFTFQGSILLVGAVVGPAAVAVYSVLRTLANLVRQIVGSINNVLWPELTSLDALNDYARLRKIHALLVKGTFALCSTAAIFLHFEAKDIVAYWTGGRIIFDQTLMDLFLIYLVLEAPWLSSSLFLSATNHHKKLAIIYIVSGASGIILGYLFSSQIIGLGLGARGAILGILLGEISTAGWYVPRLSCRMFSERVSTFWIQFVLRGALAIALQYCGAWMISTASQNLLIRLLGICMWISIVLFIVSYFLWLTHDERVFIRRLGVKILTKRFSFSQS